jgi:ACS family hexuronate transporter-like MFS transporter
LSSLILDLYPKQLVGTVFGVVAAGSGLGGMLSTGFIGFSVTHYSYAPVFLAMGIFHPLALLLILPMRRYRANVLAVEADAHFGTFSSANIRGDN